MSCQSPATPLYEQLRAAVHIWFCQPALVQGSEKISACEKVLSEEEKQRYLRFHAEKDRHSYLVSHAMLRQVLSKYAGVPASQWQFTANEHGRPELATPVLEPGLQFNLTHTEGLSACVIAAGRRCGIDAEYVHRKNKLFSVAKRMFAEEELAQLDEKNIQQQFYNYWTLREAYVKALGTGLAGSSKAFYFTLGTKNLSAVLQHKDKVKSDNWRFKLLRPTAEHVLATGFEATKNLPVEIHELIF